MGTHTDNLYVGVSLGNWARNLQYYSYSLTVLQSYSITVLQSYSRIVLQYYSLTDL